MSTYNPAASRSARRRVSRVEARRQADAYFGFVGLEPRYEPARNDTCQQHHRRLPCKRCTEAGDQ